MKKINLANKPFGPGNGEYYKLLQALKEIIIRDQQNPELTNREVRPEQLTASEQSNKDYTKEQILTGLQMAINNGSLNFTPEEIFKKAQTYFKLKGIDLIDIENLFH